MRATSYQWLGVGVLVALLVSASPVAAEWQAGLDALRNKDYAAAEAEFEEVTKTNPDYAGAYYMLGVAQRSLGKMSQALANLRKAVELDSSQAAWKVVLGQTLIQAKQYGEALTVLRGVDRSALKSSERSSHALLLANAATKADQPQAAISVLSEQVRAEPNNASLHSALGVAYDESGDEAKAMQSFKKAYELDPKDERAGGEAVRLGKTLGRRATSAQTKRNYYTEAAQIAEKIASSSATLDHYLDAGEAWMGAKQYEKALGWFDKARAKYPQNAHVRFYRGQCYSSLERFDESITELKEALKIGPPADLRKLVYETMGYVYDKQKKYDLAEQVYSEAGNQRKVAEMRDKQNAQAQNLQAEEEKQRFIAQVAALRHQIEELEKLGQSEEVEQLRQQLADLEKALKELQ